MKDVTEVGATCGTGDFVAKIAIGVGCASDSAGNFLVETGPAAVGVEFGVGGIEGGMAAFAEVGAGLPVLVVLARMRRFGAAVFDDVFFGWGKGVGFHDYLEIW